LVPVTYTCFPPPNYLFIDINVYNRGFPSEFLITQWWQEYPGLLATLYVFGAIQLIFAIAGIFMSIGRKPDRKQDAAKQLELFAFHKLLPLFNSTWQLALSGLIILLPTQWLSNTTMGMILFHAWSEFFALILRFMLVRRKITPTRVVQYYYWIITLGVITAVPFMLGSNPYIQGIISAFPVLPADFLNLVVAPYLSIKWVMQHKDTFMPSEKVSEILTGLMSVVHVVWFYGQGIIACLVDLRAGAQFFVAWQVINTIMFGAVVISYGLTISAYNEWKQPKSQFRKLLYCCFCFDATNPNDAIDDEEKLINEDKGSAIGYAST